MIWCAPAKYDMLAAPIFRLAPDEVACDFGKYGLTRYVAHQAYYSLIGRDYEWELLPLALDQKWQRSFGVRWGGGG